MSSPPTLNYAPPPPPPRGLGPAIGMLIVLGTLYACAIAFFCIGFPDVFASDVSLIVFAAVSALLFFTAAIRMRRGIYHWARIAFFTALVNIAAFLAFFAFYFLGTSIVPHPDMVVCFVFPLPLALLILVAQLLFSIMRRAKQSS
jgi:hypothetical protein